MSHNLSNNNIIINTQTEENLPLLNKNKLSSEVELSCVYNKKNAIKSDKKIKKIFFTGAKVFIVFNNKSFECFEADKLYNATEISEGERRIIFKEKIDSIESLNDEFIIYTPRGVYIYNDIKCIFSSADNDTQYSIHNKVTVKDYTVTIRNNTETLQHLKFKDLIKVKLILEYLIVYSKDCVWVFYGGRSLNKRGSGFSNLHIQLLKLKRTYVTGYPFPSSKSDKKFSISHYRLKKTIHAQLLNTHSTDSTIILECKSKDSFFFYVTVFTVTNKYKTFKYLKGFTAEEAISQSGIQFYHQGFFVYVYSWGLVAANTRINKILSNKKKTALIIKTSDIKIVKNSHTVLLFSLNFYLKKIISFDYKKDTYIFIILSYNKLYFVLKSPKKLIIKDLSLYYKRIGYVKSISYIKTGSVKCCLVCCEENNLVIFSICVFSVVLVFSLSNILICFGCNAEDEPKTTDLKKDVHSGLVECLPPCSEERPHLAVRNKQTYELTKITGPLSCNKTDEATFSELKLINTSVELHAVKFIKRIKNGFIVCLNNNIISGLHIYHISAVDNKFSIMDKEDKNVIIKKEFYNLPIKYDSFRYLNKTLFVLSKSSLYLIRNNQIRKVFKCEGVVGLEIKRNKLYFVAEGGLLVAASSKD
ncbi:hypothetical protein CDIK_0551 [Cucumispora dikerogammari]|nr:hypothetical protein CDIK_0551 [Cucumispora dikerogammari]